MKAYEFAKLLVSNISSPNAEIEICDDQYKEQYFDSGISKVYHSTETVVLGAHLDYSGDDLWINTVGSLKEWFIKNGVKLNYTVEFENHDSEKFSSIKAVKKDVFKLV